MSLLLLFPGGRPGWVTISANGSDWTISHYDFKNIWSEWATYSWGSIASSNYTWAYMAGLTFQNSNTNTTTWTVVNVGG